jgi:hypothetical protein
VAVSARGQVDSVVALHLLTCGMEDQLLVPSTSIMAATTEVPSRGTWPWGDVLGGLGARTMSFNAVVPMTYNGTAPPPFVAATTPEPSDGVSPTPSTMAATTNPTYGATVIGTAPFRGVSLIPSHGAAPTAYHGGTPMNVAPPGWPEWWTGVVVAALGPDWLRTDRGASTSAGIDMNAEGGMERPPVRGTYATARGRGSSVP